MFPRDRMFKRKRLRMQRLTLQLRKCLLDTACIRIVHRAFLTTVNRISGNRMSDVLQMHANLVEPPCLQPHLKQREVVIPLCDFVVRDSTPPLFHYRRHAPPVSAAPCNLCIDCPRCIRRYAADYGDIPPRHRARF